MTVAPGRVAATFALSDEEWRLVETRAALRAIIGDASLGVRLAPFAAFVLALGAILALHGAGVMGKRPAEIAFLAAFAAFVASGSLVKRAARMESRRRLAALKAWRAAGPLRLEADAAQTELSGRGFRLAWRRGEGAAFEAFEGLLLWWPRNGPPALAPRRALNEAEATALEGFWRGG